MLFKKAFCRLSYILPHHFISRGLFWLSRCQFTALQTLLKRWFVWQFDLNMDEAENSDINTYPTLNQLFTRSLKAEARPIADAKDAIASPADGKISCFGSIQEQTLIQAKGYEYNLAALFGGNEALAKEFEGGDYCTVYLSPKDYHRLHMPMNGELKKMIYVPGRLFSVSITTTQTIPNIFTRNERVICLFENEHGTFAMILVGAINVAAIETVWAGLITPPHQEQFTTGYVAGSVQLKKGEEMGRFNMGSTVILVTSPSLCKGYEHLDSMQSIQLGEQLGSIATN